MLHHKEPLSTTSYFQSCWGDPTIQDTNEWWQSQEKAGSRSRNTIRCLPEATGCLEQVFDCDGVPGRQTHACHLL